MFTDYDQVDAEQTTYHDVDVNDGATYYYQVQSANAVGSSASSSSASAYTPIAAPDELSADPVSSTEIDLTWENNSARAIKKLGRGVRIPTRGEQKGSWEEPKVTRKN